MQHHSAHTRDPGSREGKCPQSHTEEANRPQLETLFLHETHFTPRHTQNISSWGQRTCQCGRVKQPSSFGLFLLLLPFVHGIPTTIHGVGTNPNTEQRVRGIYFNFKTSSLTYQRVLSAPGSLPAGSGQMPPETPWVVHTNGPRCPHIPQLHAVSPPPQSHTQ